MTMQLDFVGIRKWLEDRFGQGGDNDGLTLASLLGATAAGTVSARGTRGPIGPESQWYKPPPPGKTPTARPPAGVGSSARAAAGQLSGAQLQSALAALAPFGRFLMGSGATTPLAAFSMTGSEPTDPRERQLIASARGVRPPGIPPGFPEVPPDYRAYLAKEMAAGRPGRKDQFTRAGEAAVIPENLPDPFTQLTTALTPSQGGGVPQGPTAAPAGTGYRIGSGPAENETGKPGELRRYKLSEDDPQVSEYQYVQLGTDEVGKPIYGWKFVRDFSTQTEAQREETQLRQARGVQGVADVSAAQQNIFTSQQNALTRQSAEQQNAARLAFDQRELEWRQQNSDLEMKSRQAVNDLNRFIAEGNWADAVRARRSQADLANQQAGLQQQRLQLDREGLEFQKQQQQAQILSNPAAVYMMKLLGNPLGIPGLANGGTVPPGQPFISGERGPEMNYTDPNTGQTTVLPLTGESWMLQNLPASNLTNVQAGLQEGGARWATPGGQHLTAAGGVAPGSYGSAAPAPKAGAPRQYAPSQRSAQDVLQGRIGIQMWSSLPPGLRDFLTHFIRESGASDEKPTGQPLGFGGLSLQDLATLRPEHLALAQAVGAASGSFADIFQASRSLAPQPSRTARFVGA